MRARKGGRGRVGGGEQGGGLLENLVRGQTLKAREGHKVYPLKAGIMMGGRAHSGASGPIPKHDLCPLITDHYQTSGAFQKSNFPLRHQCDG